jgi:hypothetical protein
MASPAAIPIGEKIKPSPQALAGFANNELWQPCIALSSAQ